MRDTRDSGGSAAVFSGIYSYQRVVDVLCCRRNPAIIKVRMLRLFNWRRQAILCYARLVKTRPDTHAVAGVLASFSPPACRVGRRGISYWR